MTRPRLNITVQAPADPSRCDHCALAGRAAGLTRLTLRHRRTGAIEVWTLCRRCREDKHRCWRLAWELAEGVRDGR